MAMQKALLKWPKLPPAQITRHHWPLSAQMDEIFLNFETVNY